jgi:hypothetical protein
MGVCARTWSLLMTTLPQRIVAALVTCLATPVSLALGAAPLPGPASAPTVNAATTIEPFRISRVAANSAGLAPQVLDLALTATRCGVASGDLVEPRTLTVIDYSRPSVEPRLWVFDLGTGQMLFREHVAHGVNTGDNMARYFSDTPNSRQTSIGLFVARETYVGSNGYSLRMDGLEPGFNSRARERAIVMHGAPYVDEQMAARQGRLGRSWGCPALRDAVARQVIDTVRDGGIVFSYYPDAEWLGSSRFLNCGASTPALAALLPGTAAGS